MHPNIISVRVGLRFIIPSAILLAHSTACGVYVVNLVEHLRAQIHHLFNVPNAIADTFVVACIKVLPLLRLCIYIVSPITR